MNEGPPPLPKTENVVAPVEPEHVEKSPEAVEAPEGWLTARALGIKLGITPQTVNKLADTLRGTNPEWFRSFIASNKKLHEHYSPELITAIENHYAKNEPAPEGWVTIYTFAKELKKDFETVHRRALRLAAEHPEWLHEYESATGPARTSVHCSPELMRLVKESLSVETAPEGWFSMGALARSLAKDYSTIWKAAERYRPEHPDWFKEYRMKGGQVVEHYSPELVRLIEEVIGQFEAPLPGWLTAKRLARELGTSGVTVKAMAEKHRDAHPEWFREFQTNGIYEYYAPELVKIIWDGYLSHAAPPKGWITCGLLRDKTGKASKTIENYANEYRDEHPEWFKEFRTDQGVFEHYAPILVDTIRKRLQEEMPPPGWSPNHSLAKALKVNDYLVKRIADKYRTIYPQWFKEYRAKSGLTDFYAPELATIVSKELAGRTPPPEGWVSLPAILSGTERSRGPVENMLKPYRASNPEWFGMFWSKRNHLDEHYAPELVQAIAEQLLRKFEPVPDGWKTRFILAKELHTNPERVAQVVGRLQQEYADGIKEFLAPNKRTYEYYSPALVSAICEQLARPAVDPITGVHLDTNDQVYAPVSFFEDKLGLPYKKLAPHLQGIASISGNDRHGRETVLYHEGELMKALREAGYFSNEQRKEVATGITGAERRELALQQGFIDFAKDAGEGTKIEAKQFRELVSLFGSSRVIDVLYNFHPEFKGLPVQWINSVMAEYLGDFLVVRHGFRTENLSGAAAYLHEPNLREGLLEVMKESCLEYYHIQKKANPMMNNRTIVKNYLATVREETSGLGNEDLNTVIRSLEEYYERILSIQKPARVVESVSKAREFPDFNQLINIQEISDKKKLLIADEMGLGKSASVILAKECLGVRQALVIAPSSVIETWRGYLSAYFKRGEEPSVLVVSNVDDLRGDVSKYEYILLSQERLTDEYTEELLKLDSGMLIVDEVHKLKNLREGVRAQNLISLAQKIKGDDNYLAILSGTPVPNKVADVAMILKLLYPERFEHVDSKEMVENIIHGDILDLRSLLTPRMQMKSLKESVEMPQYIEHLPIPVELTPIEKDIYGALLEEDELTATQKIQLLRQFVLNPEIIDATPGLPSSKFAKFEEHLKQDFERVDKIVVFVNNYVDGVIRGEKSLIPKLDVPEDVEIRVIEGEVQKNIREEIQKELNTSKEKILLFVSGQTADVGVDFSGGEMVYFFNEPWTKADQAQQLARVYRPGLAHDLESKTFITNGTIEEGIHRFIALKQRGIEKLIRGVPLTELDQEILTETEKQDESQEVNPELARYYFNSWDMLMKIFGEVREIGERDFMSYLDRHGRELTRGEEYAKAYFDLGNRSYQSNANRIAATLIRECMTEARQKLDEISILDLASGPEMLKRHSAESLSPAITSMDINPVHFMRSEGGKRIVGGLTHLPFAEQSFDYVNCTFALHYTRLVPSRGELERFEVFKEMNCVLKDGGRAVINLIYKLDFRDFESFKKNVELFGFKVVDDYTGQIEEDEWYKSKVVTLEKTHHLGKDFSVEELVDGMDRYQINSFKFQDIKDKLRNQRRIITGFSIGDNRFDIQFNSADQKVYEEEQAILKKGQELKVEHGGIEGIPREEVIQNLFIRYRPKNSYRLFRRLQVGEGGVVIK